MTTNNYKRDDNKPPVLDAVLIPYRRSLLAIAAMKADMAVKHKLQGAVNPFLEWTHLPDAKKRLSNAGARHILDPWSLNTQDALPGTPGHLHMVHGIVGLLMALEKHLEAVDAGLVHVPGVGWRGTGLAEDPREPLQVPAGADWRESPPACGDFVASSDNPRDSCVKDRGHKGQHETSWGLRWPAVAVPWAQRLECAAKDRPGGDACQLPNGHSGPHAWRVE